jgi:hypothetical protein
MSKKINALILSKILSSLESNDEENQDQDECEQDELFTIGEQYFIRTVTYHAVGVCDDIVNGFVRLKKAMWVADSGRLADALKNGIEKQSSAELEPFPNKLFININSIVDFCKYEPKIVFIQK